MSGSGELGIDPFEGVASLLDKSLLRQEAGPGGEPRFTMLETVREFALEQLAASGEEMRSESATHPGVWRWWRRSGSILSRAAPRLPGWPVWTPNWTTSCCPRVVRRGRRAHQRAPAAVGDLLAYWSVRPYHAEVRGWLEPALRAAPDAPTAVRVEALYVAARPASSATGRPPSPTRRKGWRSPGSLATRLPSVAPISPSAWPGRSLATWREQRRPTRRRCRCCGRRG